MSLRVARRSVTPGLDTDTERKEIETTFVRLRLIVALIMGSVKEASQVAEVDDSKNLTISFEGRPYSHPLPLSLPLEEQVYKLGLGTYLADYLGLNAALYEWAESYDSKDWDRLRKCIAPTLRVRSFPFPLSAPFSRSFPRPRHPSRNEEK